jgi:hypothetical protein
MPGPYIRPIPMRSGRRHFSLRGTVTGLISMTTGKLWWKKELHGVKIAFSPTQYAHLRATGGHIVLLGESGSEELRSTTKVFFHTHEEAARYDVGMEVGLTYGTASRIEQFFEGSPPIALLHFGKIEHDTELENEVNPPQTELSFAQI